MGAARRVQVAQPTPLTRAELERAARLYVAWDADGGESMSVADQQELLTFFYTRGGVAIALALTAMGGDKGPGRAAGVHGSPPAAPSGFTDDDAPPDTERTPAVRAPRRRRVVQREAKPENHAAPSAASAPPRDPRTLGEQQAPVAQLGSAPGNGTNADPEVAGSNPVGSLPQGATPAPVLDAEVRAQLQLLRDLIEIDDEFLNRLTEFENGFVTSGDVVPQPAPSVGAAPPRLRLVPPFDPNARPKTRGECAGVERPCPFVSCQYHLFLDVSPRTGKIRLSFPGVEVWDLAETCALDVADRGGLQFRAVGALTGVSHERIRQLEESAAKKIRGRLRALGLEEGFAQPADREAALVG